MAIRPLNSVAGFSVGETPANIILANGDINTTNITLTGVSNLNSISNVKVSGGSSGQVIQTDGSGNLSFVTISTSGLTNGSSNINVTSSGNILFSVAGAANVGVFTSTGLNVSGYITATGNITSLNANLGNAVDANYFIGSGNNLSNIQGANVSGTVANANYAAYAGTVTGSSQGNITSVGTLTALDVSATVNAQSFSSNVATGTAPLSVLSTTKVTNLNADFLDGFDSSQSNTANTVAVRDVSGNISATYFIGDGSQLTGIDTSLISNGNSNVKVASGGNVTVSVAGNANVVTFTGTGASIAGNANVTGNVIAGGVKTDNLYYANGTPWDLTQPAGSNTQIQYNDGAGGFGASANFTYNDATQLLTVTGNIDAVNVDAGNLMTANYVAGTLTTNAQPNITSVGALTSLSVTGNANVGNLGTGRVIATGNISGTQIISNIATGTAPLIVTSTTRVANLNVANAGYADAAGTAGTVTTNAQPNITSVGTLSSLSVTGNTSSGNFNTAGKVVASTLESNVATGTAPFVVESTTKVANLNADLLDGYNTATTATANTVVIRDTNGSFSANIITANLSGNATTAGTVTTNAQPNITSVGTLSSLSVTGNISGGNVSGGNLVSANYLSGTLTTAAQPNITSVGNLTSLDVTGNIAANNITTTNKITAGNGLQVTSGGLEVVAGNVDITGNLNVTGNVNYSNVTDLVIQDPLIYIGEDNPGDAYDLGIVASFTEGTYQHTGIARNAGDNTWTFFDGVVQEPTTTIDWANATYPSVKMGNLIAVANANIGGYANIVGNANIGNVGAGAGVFTANVTAANIYANSGTIGASLLAGTLTTNAQPNITSVGTLTSVTVTGNTVSGNVYANSGIIGAQTLKGEGGNISNIAGANVTGQVGNALIAGTVYTNAQPNITSVGTLTSLTVSGNVSSGNISATSANVTTANVSGKVNLGNTTVTTSITWASVTTTSTSTNQTIASLPVSGITGVEYLVKAVDSTGSKYSVASVIAVTDGSTVDYSTYGTVQLGGYTGSLAVNIVGTDIRLQVTPASSNSTVWTTQYRLI